MLSQSKYAIPRYKNHKEITMFIFDYHRNYELPTVEGVRCEIALNLTVLHEIYDISAIKTMLQSLPLMDVGPLSMPSGVLYYICGEQPQIIQFFDQFLERLKQRPSGDDEIFDFWPNAWEMAEKMADDIDEITKSNICHNKIDKAYKYLVKKFGKEDWFDETWKPSWLNK